MATAVNTQLPYHSASSNKAGTASSPGEANLRLIKQKARRNSNSAANPYDPITHAVSRVPGRKPSYSEEVPVSSLEKRPSRRSDKLNVAERIRRDVSENNYHHGEGNIEGLLHSPQPPAHPRDSDDRRSPARQTVTMNTADVPGSSAAAAAAHAASHVRRTSRNSNGLPELRRQNSQQASDANYGSGSSKDTMRPHGSVASRRNDGSSKQHISQKHSSAVGPASGTALVSRQPLNQSNLQLSPRAFAYEPGRAEVGLENLGNTCFMNSTLQCLLHAKPLAAFFLSQSGEKFEKLLNLASPKKGVLAVSFMLLMREVYSKRAGSSVSPIHLQRTVGKYAPYLMDYQQQDSQEFLRFLLDGIAEDLCRKYSEEENLESDQPNESSNSPQCTSDFSSSGDSHFSKGGNKESILPALPSTQSEIKNNNSESTQNRSNQLEENGSEVQSYGTGKGTNRLRNDVKFSRRLSARDDSELSDIAEESFDSDSLVRYSSTAPNVLPSAPLQQQVTSHVEVSGTVKRKTSSNQPNYERGTELLSGLEKEAKIAWNKYLRLNDSIITDIFAGQLQSTIECLTCNHRSSTFDPFLDLSVPIHRDNENETRRSFLGSLRGSGSYHSSSSNSNDNKSTLEKCLEKFTAEEILDGDNMYTCEKCKKKRKSVKRLSIFKYPQVLVIHIKRFRFNSTRREKLSTDVHFPTEGLDLSTYVSPDLSSNSNNRINAPVYDLFAVSNHHGSLNSGHYIAHVDVNNHYIGGSNNNTNSNGARWLCFNDARVSTANSANVTGPTAYVLFYQIRQGSTTITTSSNSNSNSNSSSSNHSKQQHRM